MTESEMITAAARKRRLDWWSRADEPDRWCASGRKGRYVVTRRGPAGYWNVDHRRGRGGKMRRQLVADAPTLAAAMAIAQADSEQD
jgi:hypothetical protein